MSILLGLNKTYPILLLNKVREIFLSTYFLEIFHILTLSVPFPPESKMYYSEH